MSVNTTHFTSPLTQYEAEAFCARWLPAWTGNRPEALLEFYARDAYYADPAVPDGLRGREAMAAYFAKLLAANPRWIWETQEVHCTPRGFTLKWHARIPTPGGVLEQDGLDIVEIADGVITRNEVYFDRTPLLAALRAGKEG
ncbi:MAG: nuclear transport factor 2 family protein [Deltaproteobacteria bacterium]|nr:nuclear transport factor 2 family protein [bacterium]MCB9490079.1 nuclear transport factor 2 family protein [Deltaproteobacteria bacterium]